MSVSTSSPSLVLKISVYRDGHFEVDGVSTTMQGLKETLKRLKERHGMVWYYREAGNEEPQPIAMSVLQSIMEAGVPISFSSRPDFSDSIDDQGRSVPRK